MSLTTLKRGAREVPARRRGPIAFVASMTQTRRRPPRQGKLTPRPPARSRPAPRSALRPIGLGPTTRSSHRGGIAAGGDADGRVVQPAVADGRAGVLHGARWPSRGPVDG